MVRKIEPSHWLKKDFLNIVKDMSINISKVKDIKVSLDSFKEEENLGSSQLMEIDLGVGTGRILMKPKDGIFYKVLSEICDLDVSSESDLLSLVKELNVARKEYDKVKDALIDVKETGYGLVAPQLS